MIGSDRRRDRPVRHLEWRVRLFAVAAVLAVAGLAREASLLIWVALAVLGVAFAMRFVPETGLDESPTPAGEEE